MPRTAQRKASGKPAAPAPKLEDLQGELMEIPLSRLVPSAFNVRGVDDDSDVSELAELIAAQGRVLLNLVVHEDLDDKGKPTGDFGVCAGGRRRRACLKLVAEGRLHPDTPIICLKISVAEAIAASRAENGGREPLHPADEFRAYVMMRAEGKSDEEIGFAFGVTPVAVKRALKLANVAPEFVAMFKAGTIGLGHMQAFAVTDDHDEQRRVWESLQAWNRTAHMIRQHLLKAEVHCKAPLARFVGLQAYKKAGGLLREDLFGGEGETYIANAELLGDLALKKLEKAVPGVAAEGWGWVEHRIDFTEADRNGFTKAKATRRAATEQEEAKLTELQQKLDANSEAMNKLEEADEYDDDAGERLDAEADAIREEMTAIEDGLSELTLETMKHAGAVVSVGKDGKLLVARGLVKPEDRKSATAAAAVGDHGPANDAAAGEPSRPQHSEAMVQRLSANKTAALQHVLAGNVHVALAALAHNLASRVILDEAWPSSALSVRANDCEAELTRFDDTIVDLPAFKAVQAQKAKWRAVLEQHEEAHLLKALIDLAPADLNELLALCTALTVNATQGRDSEHDSDALASAVKLDMADHWHVSPSSYLGHVPKVRILAAVTEAVSPEAATAIEKMKKQELVTQAGTLLDGRRWLPSPLRARECAVAEVAEA